MAEQRVVVPTGEPAVSSDATDSVATMPAPTNTLAVAKPLWQQLRVLASYRTFWVGLGVKLLAAALLGGTIATHQFSAFLYQFVSHPFTDPFRVFIERGQVEAFPYGPVMLGFMSLSWWVVAPFDFDPSSNLGLFLLRLPLLVADLTICVLLLWWLRIRPRLVVLIYWVSPILLYATYVHGQLDLVPTAFLCATLWLLFRRRVEWAAVVFGLGLATKLHLLVAFPFLVIHMYRVRRHRARTPVFVGLSLAVGAALYALPMRSPWFRQMVFQTPQSEKLWATVIPYGDGQPVLFLGPAMLVAALVTFASYRRVNREMTLMYLGAVYVGLMAFVPPQPGWYLWSLPFMAYMGAQYNRTRRIHLLALSLAYLGYFGLARPEEFIGSLDPILGAGFGTSAAQQLQASVPGLFAPRTSSIAWTVLFATTVVTALEMYRRGVASDAVYNFRDQPFMIGIGGDSGAGKHTIGRDLEGLLGGHHSTLHGDDDHKWERGHKGWETFTHLDPRANMLVRQFEALKALRRGSWTEKRHYDHDVGRFTAPLEVEDNAFISIVGLHPFYLPSQRQLLDLKVFVHPDEQVRRSWKVQRDMAKRGYSEERVIAQIEKRMPDSEKYVLPQMRYADIVIRHRSAVTRAASEVDLQIEIRSDLESMTLLDALDQLTSLDVSWSPDPDLMRDQISMKGHVTPEVLAELAYRLIPNLDELIESETWRPGGSGLTQLVLLYAISVRLRTEQVGRT